MKNTLKQIAEGKDSIEVVRNLAREALAQPEQEPVAHVLFRQDDDGLEPVMFYPPTTAPDPQTLKDRFILKDVWLSPPQRKPLTDEQRTALRDAFAQALTGVYVCGRVWEAWQYGTMSEGDFQPASECEEVLDSIIEAAHSITE